MPTFKLPEYNRTKIVATIGPASSSPQILEQMIEAGMDVVRINLSHGKYEDIVPVIEAVRKVNVERGLHTCILVDLQGPKLRIGDVENGLVHWESGQDVRFTTIKQVGTKDVMYMTYQAFPKDVQVGDKVLVDDGKLELQVTATNGVDEVVAKVTYGGPVTPKKGVNLPNTKISLPSLTEKDLADLEFALDNDVEWVGLSFVRKAEDIHDLRQRIEARGKKTKIVAKIEKPEAVELIDEIIAATDAVMIARGDLGVEMPMEEVPLIQKLIVKKCLIASKPVIIATQMMESMITNARPTRAEVNDVANAVIDGADAVMLSGETSVGAYPILAIQSMDKIINKVEADRNIYNGRYALNKQSPTFLSDAVCLNAVLMSKEISAKAIISLTKSGYTAYKLSSFRPEAKVYIFSDDRELLNTINLVWGVRGFLYEKLSSTDETFADVIEILKDSDQIHVGDLVVHTASMPIEARGRTNALKVTQV